MNPEDYEEQNVGGKQFKRKNTKKWCKGKVGREHVEVIELDEKHYGYRRAWGKEIRCGEVMTYYPSGRKACYHHVICENCGKELKYKPQTCPTTGLETGW